MVIAKTRAEYKWSSLLSERGRSEAQVYDIHACYSVLFSVHRGPLPFLRYPIHRFAFWQREEMISAVAPPPPPPLVIQDARMSTVLGRSEYQSFFSPSSPNYYFIIWLLLPRCCQNASTFPQRWKTNSSNLFLQIRYWSQLVCWASDIFPEKWMSNGKHHYFFYFHFPIKKASTIAVCFVCPQ